MHLLLVLLLPFFTHAQNEGGVKNKLSVASGMASPSNLSALGENPAGLIYNRETLMAGSLGSGLESATPYGYGLHFFKGNGTGGTGFGAQMYNNQLGVRESPNDPELPKISLLNWGLASVVEAFNTSVGVMVARQLHKQGEVHGTATSDGKWGLDIGAIYNPNGGIRVGTSFFQVTESMQAVGVGMAADISSLSTFAVDMSYNPPSSTAAMKFGLSLYMPEIQISTGYGFRFAGNGWTWIRSGPSAAVSISPRPRLNLQFYYNHIAMYYLGVVITL